MNFFDVNHFFPTQAPPRGRPSAGTSVMTSMGKLLARQLRKMSGPVPAPKEVTADVRLDGNAERSRAIRELIQTRAGRACEPNPVENRGRQLLHAGPCWRLFRLEKLKALQFRTRLI